MMTTGRQSIQSRVLIAIFVAVSVPLAIFLIFGGRSYKDLVVRGEMEKVAAVNRELAQQVEKGMVGAVRALSSLQTNPFLVDPEATPEDRHAEMERLVGIYDMFSDISIYDLSGDIVDSTSYAHTAVMERTSWFQRALDGQISISAPEVVRGTEGLHLTVYLKVESNHRGAQVIKGRLPFTGVWELLDGVKVGEEGFVVLLDDRGNVLAHPDRSLIYEKFDTSRSHKRWFVELEGSYVTEGGMEYLYQSEVLEADETGVGTSWVLVSFIPQSEIDSVVWEAGFALLPLIALALVPAIAVALVFANRLSRPIVAAAATARKVANGDLSARIRKADNGSVEMDALAGAFNHMVGEVAGHQGALESLVERRTSSLRQSQRDLRELMAQLRSTYESTKEAVLVLDTHGKVIAANGRFSEFFGLEEEACARMRADDLRARIEGCFEDAETFSLFWDSAIDGNTECEGEMAIVHPERRELSTYTAPVRSSSGREIAQLWMFRDLTEQRGLQRSLEQAQKMEAVGQLAGGIAHDFNNLLTGIIGNLSLAELELCDAGHGDGELEKRLTSAKSAAERGAELVSNLLGFSRQSHLQLGSCKASEIITDVHELISATFDPRIVLDIARGEGAWLLEADPTQVEQVIMNLCVNAKDAMSGGGTLSIRCRNLEQIPTEVARSEDSDLEGEFVVIEVSDTGTGIPEEIQSKLFEPFFTTKEQGKGTGLGLAMSYGIIKQHGGLLTCRSVLGEGTTFSIYLPRFVPTEEGDKSGLPAQEAEVPKAETVECQPAEDCEILLVDDEMVVRAVAEGLLKREGYSIVTASDGVEALELLEAPGGADRFSVVMLDLTMPRLGGAETFQRIREAGITTPVVICSGYLLDFDDFAAETGSRPEAFVQKPYQPLDLFNAVADLIRDAGGVQAGGSTLTVAP